MNGTFPHCKYRAVRQARSGRKERRLTSTAAGHLPNVVHTTLNRFEPKGDVTLRPFLRSCVLYMLDRNQ